MGLFEDLSRFLENRLDEFLKANPHLELMALEEQLRGQEEDTINLLGDLKRRQQQLEDSILSTAQEIQRWHERIRQAEAAHRPDLAQPAKAREAALLRQGNHLWGQMQGIKNRLEQTRELQRQIHDRRRELKVKMAAAEANRTTATAASQSDQTAGWQQTAYAQFNQPVDPLEETFQRWETEEELEALKRQMRS